MNSAAKYRVRTASLSAPTVRTIAVRALAAALITLVFAFSACAAGTDADAERTESGGADLNTGAETVVGALPSGAKGAASEAAESGLDAGLSSLWKDALALVAPSISDAAACAAKLLGVLLVCGICSAVFTSGGETASRALSAASVLACAAVAVSDASSMLSLGTGAISSMDVLAKTMIPTLTAASAAAGAAAKAVAWQTGFMVCSDLLIMLIRRAFVPLLIFFISLKAVACATGQAALGRAADGVKSFVSGALKLCLTAFLAYIGVTGALGGAADSVLKRTAKAAVGAAVPVVGGVVADAADSVIAGAALMRSTIGIAGAVGVLAICAEPFIKIGAYYAVMKLAMIFLAPISTGGSSEFLSALADSFALIFGMTAASATLLLLSVISAVTTAAG